LILGHRSYFIEEFEETTLDLKKVSTEIAITEIVDTLDTTSDKHQEALDGPASFDVEDMIGDWNWCQQHF
jgi:hypothetical protein